jgi:tripartite-type tricarboxylate transporter receptor subunit TctC
MVALSPVILVPHPSVPANSVKYLVKLPKSKPGAIGFASSGGGSTAHWSSKLFKHMTGIQIATVLINCSQKYSPPLALDKHGIAT